MGFSHRQASHGISVQIQLRNFVRMLFSDILIDRALIDSKQKLFFIDGIFQRIQSGHLLLTALQPSCSALHRLLHIASLCHRAWTLIECHGNGGCQVGLNLHTLLRSHKDLSPVNMGIEIDSLFFDLSKLCKGKDLKAAGICEDRPVPVHELMKTAHGFHLVVARTHMQMIRIGKLYLRSDFPQIHGRYCALNRSHRTHIHKYRCLDRPVNRMEFCPLGTSLCFYQFIFRHSFLLDFFWYHSHILPMTPRPKYILLYYSPLPFSMNFIKTTFSLPLSPVIIVKLLHCHFETHIV